MVKKKFAFMTLSVDFFLDFFFGGGGWASDFRYSLAHCLVPKKVSVEHCKRAFLNFSISLISYLMEGDTGQKCNCSSTACCIISYHALIPETTRCVVISYPICRFIVLLKP